MSLPMLVAVFNRSRATGGARLVLLALAEFAHDDGTSAFPAVPTLAARARMSDRGVQKCLRRLEQLGEIERQGETRAGTTIWRIVLPAEGEHRSPVPVNDAASGGERRSPNPSGTGETSKTSQARARDPLFDALATSCGFALDRMTKEAARLCGIAAGEIRKAGGTPELIPAAVANYRRLYVGAAVTPKAVANHWPAIAPREHDPSRGPCPECSVGGGNHTSDCSRASKEDE